MARSYRKWLLILVLIAGAVIGTLAYRNGQVKAEKQEADRRTQATAATVEGIGALGRLEPRSRVIQLSHDAGPEGARIETLNVEEGSVVRKGDVIATYSDLPRKEAKLKAAEASIAVIEANIRAEEANSKFFGLELTRAQKLSQSEAIARSQLQDAERNRTRSQSTKESLQADLQVAQAQLLLAQKEVEQSRLLSPIDGTVMKILARPGERVGDKGVALLADLTQIDAVAEIYERDMPRVQVGQKAEIIIPGFEKPFAGEVRILGYLVEKNDLNDTDPLSDRDNRIVEVRIALDPAASDKLSHLIYMQVDVRIK